MAETPRSSDANASPSWERFRLIASRPTDVLLETDAAGALRWASPSIQTVLG